MCALPAPRDRTLTSHPPPLPLCLQGLAEHKDELGAPLCPCRHYDDKAAEAEQGFWNCPCVPMRERKVRSPYCAAAVASGGKKRGCGVPRPAPLLRASNKQYLIHTPFFHLQECHCMLFLTEDNDFRGEDQEMTLEEVVQATAGM